MDTDEAARWLVAEGAKVLEAHGTVWALRPRHLGGSRGYWIPVAELSPVNAANVRWPRRLALGYRAVVSEPDQANGSLAMWFVSDLQSFDGSTINRSQRKHLRHPQPGLRIEALDSPALLLEQGFPLVREATARRGDYYLSTVSESDYRAGVVKLIESAGALLLAATVGGQLVGYMHSYAIDDVAYLSTSYVSEQGRRARAGGALKWAAIRAWQRQPGVRALSAGQQMPERPGVEGHKAAMGIPLVRLPVVSVMRAPVTALLRRYKPTALARSGLV